MFVTVVLIVINRKAMLKFFRKIRQNLLLEGRTGKYVKYAFGEIVLVVIGILIALQINTWSQRIKDSKEEHELLVKIRANIQSDTLNLKGGIDRIKSYLAALEIIENEMKDETLSRFSVDLSRPLISAVDMNLETTTWENLKSTGKLSLLKSASLVDSLQTYYQQFKNVNKSWTEGFQSYNRGILAPKFFEFDDLTFFPPESSFKSGDVQRLPPRTYNENVFFRNAVRYRIGALRSLKGIFEADMATAITMMRMLTEEIEK